MSAMCRYILGLGRSSSPERRRDRVRRKLPREATGRLPVGGRTRGSSPRKEDDQLLPRSQGELPASLALGQREAYELVVWEACDVGDWN